MSSSTPKYIYKLVPSDAPVPDNLPDKLPVSHLDQQSGFIHLSTALQVPNTLKMFFKEEPLVYVLRLEYEKVKGDIRWESPDAKVCGPRGGEGMFPVGLKRELYANPSFIFLTVAIKHLYNGQKLGKNEVESVAIWKNEGGWDHALKTAESWLIY